MINNNGKKILYISWYLAYDKVCHAGGQTFNLYLKGIAKTNDDITLVALCPEREKSKVDTEQAGVHTRLVVQHKGLKDTILNVQSIGSKVNPRHKYCNMFSTKTARMMISELRRLAAVNYQPDVIVLEWTESLLLIDEVKAIFPYARYVSSEHDVSFQRMQRRAKNEPTDRNKIRAANTYLREITALNKCDLVLTHNQKDRKLLVEAGISEEKIIVIVPKYHKSVIPYMRTNNDIVFFGDMTREENIEAARWFNERVMPMLSELPVRFEVIGKGCKYVESIDETFANAMCFVCPVLNGAGIKVKNLEALYAGIPVLTNTVGIEGIPAVPGKHYCHCETPEEYADTIKAIYNGTISVCGTELIKKFFNMEESLGNYLKVINQL